MEYIKEININEAVIHVLDNNSDVPILNEYALDLNEDMYNILLKLIKKGLNDEKLRYAVFNDEKVNVVASQSQKYLNGENNLLDVSKELAKELFNIMVSGGGIPSCDFITVSFTTEFGPILGLFKMDYIRNYTHLIQIIDDKMSIDVVPQIACLADKVQKIQKCAFIKPCREENSFDLMLIDNQSNKVDEDHGNAYFVKSFLKCVVIENERDMTKNFMAATERYARTNFREDASKQEMFRKDVKRQLEEKESIDIKEFAENIFEDNGDIESFTDHMKKYDVAKTVDIDKEYVAKKLRRTRLKIEGGIDIYIDEDTYNDKSQFEVQRNGDGTINMVIKHISNYIEK